MLHCWIKYDIFCQVYSAIFTFKAKIKRHWVSQGLKTEKKKAQWKCLDTPWWKIHSRDYNYICHTKIYDFRILVCCIGGMDYIDGAFE